MKLLRSTLCFVLVLAAVLSAPGLAAYAAAAEVFTGASGALRTGPVISVNAPALPRLGAIPALDLKAVDTALQTPVLSIPSAAVALPEAAAPLAQAILPQAQALAPVAKGVAPVLQAIARPEMGGETCAQAGEDVVTILQGGRAAASYAAGVLVPEAPASKTPALARAAQGRGAARRSLPKAFFGAGVFTLGTAASGGLAAGLIALPLMAASFVLHEVAHARAAYRLGDPGPVLDNRASLKPKDWPTHFDLVWTLIVPVAYLLASHGHSILGGAKPVEFESERFTGVGPEWGAAITAFAGPAMNLVLAGLGALAFAAAAAVAAPAVLVHALALVSVMNAAIAAFNLVPLYPFDGYFVAYAFMPKRAAAELKNFYKTSGPLAWVPAAVFIGVAMKFGLMAQAVQWLAHLLLGAHGAAVLGL